jgi:long-chain acyl-CoA synthetase
MTGKERRGIFVTGATGFLASGLIRILLDREDRDIYLLIRARSVLSLSERKADLVNRLIRKPERNRLGPRIHAVRGDLSAAGLGLSKKDSAVLKRSIDAIYHAGALCDLSCGLAEARKINVGGTENLLKLALDWQKDGRLRNVNHISTAYIAGNHKGVFYEKDIDISQRFNNNYEKSKFEGEFIVEKYRNKGLRVDIYRPGIITDAIPPVTNTVPAFLKILSAFSKGFFEEIPARTGTKMNMVPIDAACKAIYLISTSDNKPANQNYHIVNPRPLELGVLINTASDFFGFRAPKCVSRAKLDKLKMSPIRRKIIEPFVPYLNQRLSFDARNASAILGERNFIIPSISVKALVKYFSYCA